MSTTDTGTRSVHPVHVGHLVMGLAFLGLVGVWAAVQYGGVSTEDLRWLLPLPWVFAGAAGLLAVTLSGRRGDAAPVAAYPGGAYTADTASGDNAPYDTTDEPATEPGPETDDFTEETR